MKNYFLILFLFFSLINVKSQEATFSDSVVISLITCSPGEAVYTKFGHSAIRVKDSINNIDVMFNYGIFDFRTKNFYFKFIKGETDYQLGVSSTNELLTQYEVTFSAVYEQVLNLTVEEKKRLVNSLLLNYQPENRFYRYNFIFDNCSTRPRDKIFKSIQRTLHTQNEVVIKTYREWIADYVGKDTWLKFGIDLIFGKNADNIASKNTTMFLPEILMFYFQSASIADGDVEVRNLVSKRNVLVSPKDNVEPSSGLDIKPYGLFNLLLILGTLLTFWEIRRGRHVRVFDAILLTVNGIAGLIVFYLMFFSTHPLVNDNYTLLWLHPFNLLVAVLMWVKPMQKTLYYFQLLTMSLLILAIIISSVGVQQFHSAVNPLLILLLMRSSYWVSYQRGVLKKRNLGS